MGVENKKKVGARLKYPHSIDAELLRMYAKGMTVIAISKETGISDSTISKRLIEQGATPSKPRRILGKVGNRRYGRIVDWTDDMLSKLRRLYPNHTNADIADVLGLKADNVKKKAMLLGLRKDKEWLRNKRIESVEWATYKSLRSPNRKNFEKGNTLGCKFKKGKLYDKQFFEKYKRGEVSFP